jgi:hypothetical protein
LDGVVKKFADESAKQNENDFVEALMFSESEGVVMTGTMSSFAEPDNVRSLLHLPVDIIWNKNVLREFFF